MTPVVIGAGWLGRAIADTIGSEAVARRDFDPAVIEETSVTIVASGRSTLAGSEDFEQSLLSELEHLRLVLDACASNGTRAVVLGSSDVAGLASVVSGTTPKVPRTAYARMKSCLEDECIRRSRRGERVTAIRLAPVHGPGKARTELLVRLARLPLLPLPAGGRNSTGYIFLGDAVRAVLWAAGMPAEKVPPVLAAGSGPVPLRSLMESLARAQDTSFRSVPIPVPARALTDRAPRNLPDRVEWLLRLALPRTVLAEVPIELTPLERAAKSMVGS